VIEATKRIPFGNVFHVAHCESSPGKDLVPDTNISAIVTSNAGDSCEFGSRKYFALCVVAGLLSCGITRIITVPLDLVKCRIQVNPTKYKSTANGFKVTMNEDGTRGLVKGWVATIYGYSIRSIFMGGPYDVFKVLYSDFLGEENAYSRQTTVCIAAAASAEFFADIALSPMEATKIRIQTQPGFASKLRDAMSIIYRKEGLNGFYKGLVPLWMRQIPCTVIEVACFEKTIELLHRYVLARPRNECTKGQKLVGTFAAGYIAGILCAIASHPADTLVSELNQEKGSTALEAVKKLGFAGLWKGLALRIVMIGTLTATHGLIYDAVKVWLRLPLPPLRETPDSVERKLSAK
jgi:solute carrier family 25 phosphate transporter 3